ncbi:MAG: hypothetical protein A4E19_01060 [Nitrospira sp. SG-bin1]|nr:MAG: hypothetical protein A4E19_01060 [Nitrospira sp. SG-bin1]
MAASRLGAVLLTVLLISAWTIRFQSTMASDELPRSYLKIPLVSRERIPIGRILAYPDQYQMREIRLTGTITAIHTEIITNRFVCGRAHEWTMLTVEDDSGRIEVIDRGACGMNMSALKAPMVKVGEQIDLLVHILVRTNLDSRETTPESSLLFMDRVRY